MPARQDQCLEAAPDEGAPISYPVNTEIQVLGQVEERRGHSSHLTVGQNCLRLIPRPRDPTATPQVGCQVGSSPALLLELVPWEGARG